ncbi:fatty acid desaturase [Pleionea sp. CnH1-48]|uniref:fatty acid desaturase n=1 Tax=Pleionea sp. CnH1-48 TaxID=2954494 RepID=UPI002096CCBD|nr:fatty acid desaturase [Pleionea sp. CnH1-48]MCO7222775.1 fatty acid desaturase [Pleionea sp. CnH1-48]
MKKPKLIWTNILLFSITSLVAVIGVPLYGYLVGYDKYHWIATILCLGYCGISITAGYHRMWSHKAYEGHAIVRVIWAIGGAFALQNSALHWASDHRIHHRHVDDNDKDPYSAKRGFWFSHIGWMLREYQAHRYDNYDNVPDMLRDPIVMWQHRHYLTLALITNLGIPLLIGIIHGDVIGMLLTAGVLRLVISHHATFFINSLAHIWGNQPYTDQNTARDNGFLAFLTYGEGYHNFHHLFQFDYRNGIRWWHFDPTKWLIKSMSWVGLAKNLRRCDDIRIEKAKAARLFEISSKKLTQLPDKEELLQRLKDEYENYTAHLSEFYTVKKQWLEVKKDELVKNYEKTKVMQQYMELKRRLQEERENWRLLHQQIQVAA